MAKHFPGSQEKRDTSVAIATLLISFSLIQMSNGGIFEFLWDSFRSQGRFKEFGQLVDEIWSAEYVQFARDGIGSWGLAS